MSASKPLTFESFSKLKNSKRDIKKIKVKIIDEDFVFHIDTTFDDLQKADIVSCIIDNSEFIFDKDIVFLMSIIESTTDIEFPEEPNDKIKFLIALMEYDVAEKIFNSFNRDIIKEIDDFLNKNISLIQGKENDEVLGGEGDGC